MATAPIPLLPDPTLSAGLTTATRAILDKVHPLTAFVVLADLLDAINALRVSRAQPTLRDGLYYLTHTQTPAERAASFLGFAAWTHHYGAHVVADATAADASTWTHHLTAAMVALIDFAGSTGEAPVVPLHTQLPPAVDRYDLVARRRHLAAAIVLRLVAARADVDPETPLATHGQDVIARLRDAIVRTGAVVPVEA